VEIDAHAPELALHCARIEFEQPFVVALRFSVAVAAPGLRLAQRLRASLGRGGLDVLDPRMPVRQAVQDTR
jgi:hypothetical protein